MLKILIGSSSTCGERRLELMLQVDDSTAVWSILIQARKTGYLKFLNIILSSKYYNMLGNKMFLSLH